MPLLRFFALLLVAGQPCTGRAQTKPPLPTFYARYQYTGYTVYDATTPDPPTTVTGVGGALTLRPNGTYEKHLRIVANGSPHYFDQTGRFILTGDSIRFAFSDNKGPDVQRGTFQFDPATRHLTLTILGYPTGNKGVYELVAVETAAPAAAAPVAAPKALRHKQQSKRQPLR